MFLKKVLNQPNLVGSMLITLMVCGGFVYAVGFDGFNVETATGDEVEAWLEAANGGGSGGDDDDVVCPCLYLPGKEIDRECGDCKYEYECVDPQADCDTNCIKIKNPDSCSCLFGTQCQGNLCEKGDSCVVSE